jgi:hypothetical protein
MSTDEQYQLFDKNLPLSDAPAFVRRAQELESVWHTLLEQCRRERESLLKMPKLRLGVLVAITPDGDVFNGLWTSPDQAQYLRQLHMEWQPVLRSPHPPAQSAAELQDAISRLVDSFTRFNKRWQKAIEKLNLRRINDLCEDYNRFYVVEKEAALRSAKVARAGFVPLDPVTVDRLLARYPLLQIPVPRIVSTGLI